MLDICVLSLLVVVLFVLSFIGAVLCCLIVLLFGLDVSRAMVIGHVATLCCLTDRLTEQSRTNMSKPGRRPGTAVGDEHHVLQTL